MMPLLNLFVHHLVNFLHLSHKSPRSKREDAYWLPLFWTLIYPGRINQCALNPVRHLTMFCHAPLSFNTDPQGLMWVRLLWGSLDGNKICHKVEEKKLVMLGYKQNTNSGLLGEGWMCDTQKQPPLLALPCFTNYAGSKVVHSACMTQELDLMSLRL